MGLANGKPLAEAEVLLEEVNREKPSAVITEKLGDLYAAQGKPSSTVRAYEQALTLDPTPQQRVRLRLTLAEKLLASDRQSEAYGDYQKLLQEYPDYPDKLGLYRKLLPLAQKLGKQADVTHYEAEINQLSPPPPKPQSESAMPKPTTSAQPKDPAKSDSAQLPVIRRPQ
jgi:tetratricopeptide (TPR) repeat protein